MSLRPQAPPAVPEETRRIARAAFPKGTLCLRIADALGPVYQDSQFASLFPRRGRPAEAPGRLALAVVLQFVENLSDRAAAEAVRGRIDWKYALGLALSDPGFDHTVLSEFRTRLVEGGAELLLFDALLDRFKAEGLVKARGRQRTDSTHVLAAVLTRLPKIEILRQVWATQYAEEEGHLRWRATDALPPCAEQICSPYDPDARYSTKREADWVGYKVQLTETCDEACMGPHLVTNVETTPATTPDDNMVAVVHASLERRGLLPSEHLVDKGYTDSHVLVDGPRRYGTTIVGPVAADTSWQARVEGGLTKAAFRVDWERKVITCPAGKESISWLPNTWPENGMTFEVRFARRDCTPCALRPRCTRAKREPRIIGLQEREHFEALQGARKHQETEAFRASYAARAGIEGTHAQAIHRCGLRRSRYTGLAKTHLQHVIAATAINLVRVAEWFAGISVARTRVSRFAALQPAA